VALRRRTSAQSEGSPSISKENTEGGASGGRADDGSATEQGAPCSDEGARDEAGAAPVAQPGPKGARGEVIARLAADLAELARAGDVEGARHLHEAIARLLA